MRKLMVFDDGNDDASIMAFIADNMSIYIQKVVKNVYQNITINISESITSKKGPIGEP